MCPNVTKYVKTTNGLRTRMHLKTLETHLDRQASSESATEHIENTFGPTGVERERIWAHRIRIWIDSCRARAHLSIWKTHFGRRASSESAFEHIENAFGSTIVEREHILTHGKRIWIGKCRAKVQRRLGLFDLHC